MKKIYVIILSLASLHAAPSYAQVVERTDRFQRAIVSTSAPEMDPAHSPSIPAVSIGTVGGGLLFAAPFVVPWLVTGPLGCEWVCDSDIIAVIGGSAAYVVGAGVGASYTAGLTHDPPHWSRMVLTSLGAAVAGGLIWNAVGKMGEPKHPPDRTSWYIGASLGFATHVGLTTYAARRWSGDPR